MTRKKLTEAVSVSSPKSSASVPVEKKSRAKSVTAKTTVKAEKAELVTKPAHKRRKTQELSPVAAATVTTPIVEIAEAIVMKPFTQDEVAVSAYLIWMESGCPEGTAVANWVRAENELRSKAACA